MTVDGINLLAYSENWQSSVNKIMKFPVSNNEGKFLIN